MYRKTQYQQESKYIFTQSETMWTVLGLNSFSFQFWAVSHTFLWFALTQNFTIIKLSACPSYSEVSASVLQFFICMGRELHPCALWSTAGVWEQLEYSYYWAVKLPRTACVWTALGRGGETPVTAKCLLFLASYLNKYKWGGRIRVMCWVWLG